MAIDNIYGSLKNKYLDKLGIPENVYGTNWDIVSSPEMTESGFDWQKQQEECGGHDSRELFNFDTTFIEYLYTMLNMYLDDAQGVIDLTWKKFEFNNKEYTQLEAINYILDVLAKAIKTRISENFEDPDYDELEKAIALFGKILPCMWW